MPPTRRSHAEKADGRAETLMRSLAAPISVPDDRVQGDVMTTAEGFAGRYDARASASRFSASGAVDQKAILRRLRWLANALDTAVTLPGGFRFGADSVIGLVPVAGDVATAAIACYFVYEGRRLGLPRRAIAAMMGNVALDLALGAVPLVGDLADTVFKANVRNLRIIEKHVVDRSI